MAVVLTGKSLTLDEVLRVARGGERVELAPAARERVERARETVETALADEANVYGLTTGVGVRVRTRVRRAELAEFNQRLILEHRVGQGPPAPEPVEHVVARLNDGVVPHVRMLGSVGMADLPANADLVHGLLDGFELAANEALAVLDNNAFSTGLATLAIADAGRLLDALDVAAALDLEAFAASLSILHPAVGEHRPYPGLRSSLERRRRLREGSSLWDEGAARALQNPLSFRCIPQVHGAVRDALAYAEGQLAIELNAAQQNPLVVVEERRIVSVGNFDVLPLAAALDFLRLALAPPLTGASERAVKLLQAPLTGLPEGLAEETGLAESALSELALPAQALAAEARLLAQPVSIEHGSSFHHEGLA